MRLLVTRPQPDAGAQAEKLAALGHEVIAAPLLEVEFLEFSPLPLDAAQALIATSRNGLRALASSPELQAALKLPLYAVGKATADLARELGFNEIHQGPGTTEELLPLIASECEPGAGALLHLAGERQAFDLKTALEDKKFKVEQPVIYRVHLADSFAKSAREALGKSALDGVILMSPATAQTYVALVDAAGLRHMAMRLTYFCLSHAVAEPLLVLDGALVLISSSPSEDDLLALIGHETAHC
jgi:uroporphyrinogen-III synthase